MARRWQASNAVTASVFPTANDLRVNHAFGSMTPARYSSLLAGQVLLVEYGTGAAYRCHSMCRSMSTRWTSANHSPQVRMLSLKPGVGFVSATLLTQAPLVVIAPPR